MRNRALSIGMFIFAICTASAFGQDSSMGTLNVHPVPFGCNQFNNVRDFCISADGSEAYFTIQSPLQEISQIACIRKDDGIWQDPELLPFSDKWSDLEPFLSPDGLRLYFASNRPLNNKTDTIKDFDIWYVQRPGLDEAWSEPMNSGPVINSSLDEFYPSVANNGNLYFTLDGPDGMGKDDIYLCRWNGTVYDKPQLLDTSINSAGYEYNAFISPDEHFLIFGRYNEPDGYGSGDLYISYKDESGVWRPASNMGPEINSIQMDYCPFYDEVNRLLYFTSKRSAVVPRKFNEVKDLKDATEVISNGQSRIYMVRWDPQ